MARSGRGVGRRPAGPRARRSTINDVAEAAGVSRQTVTRAMNDMTGISAQTKLKVLEAARTLQYRPSRFGRGLVKPQQHTLGLVIDDLTNPYYPELASAVVGRAARSGWNVVLAETVHATDRRSLVAELALQVDAVIGYLGLDPMDADRLLDGLPVVEIDPGSRRPHHGAVSLDLRFAAVEAVDHLLAAGVRRAVMIDVSPPGRPGGRARLFVDLMAARSVPVAVVHAADNSVAAGERAAADLLAARSPVDAILAFNDVIALGALLACRRARVDVPGDVRVLGIDGLSIGTYVTPRLTTLAVDFSRVARTAVDLAVGMCDGLVPTSGPSAHRRVRHRLVVRESA